MDLEISGEMGGNELPQFFNGTKTPYDIDQKGVAITWTAFPNKACKSFLVFR